MSYNFINEASIIRTSPLCYYDTIDAYKANFNTNGDVDGWDYYDSIHTYGCWGGFIFATLFAESALIGRTTIFYPVPAESHYYVKITMKINTVERVSGQSSPTTARLQWTTTSDSSWNTDKSYDFTIYPDNEWHVYILNMGEFQYWQGDVDNLRLYPILANGRAGDEFFIKSIKISSIDTYGCRNSNCSYYANYTHPCPGIGTKGYCKSSSNVSSYYTIGEDVNDEFIININGYGDETIKLDPVSNATGPKMAKALIRAISKVGIGGYSEVDIDYTENNEFIIYSGTYTIDSSVIVVDSLAARTLGFFDSAGNDISSKQLGTNPASEALSASTFKIKAFQMLTLFDNDEDTSFYFDPFMYNVEGGRRDWLSGGLGISDVTIGHDSNTSASNVTQRSNNTIDNAGKTLIDFNHPFNASGRIKKIYAACTLDQGYESVSSNPPATNYEGRISATGCKIFIVRPRRNGNLEIVNSVDIPDRNYSGSRLYSYTQESIELDCDVWVNKGDLIGIYNANMYTGKSISGDQVDALYYQVNGVPTGEFDPGEIYGDGVAGLLFYARSDKVQDKLVIDVDLGNRVNVEDISILGSVESTNLEYNLARCLDINWSVNLFGGQHNTGYQYIGLDPSYIGTSPEFTHDNVAYGISKLSDGIYTVKDGYAADSYSIGSSSPTGQETVRATFVPTNPQYFFVNGDQEWLGVYQHKKSSTVSNPFVENFNDDPVAFILLFPYGLEKTIYKSTIYFKEKWNFRNFGIAVTYNLDDVLGDARDPRFHYLDEYTAVTMDNFRIEKDGRGYSSVDYYLFANPNHGEPIFEFSGARGANGEYLGEISNYIEYSQASNLDWTYLAHEFEPVTCKGFMFYCDYHYSTKITEMELFCRVPDLGSNLVGGMSVSYSYYEDLWWQANLEQNSNTEVTAFIGDTPRYFTIEIEPITETTLSEIRFNIKEDDLYIGAKGCEYQVLPVSAKASADNTAQIVNVKNIYNSEYDLYVDIAKDSESEGRLIYHTRMNSFDSISNPEVGPDSTYYKSEDYKLVGAYRNCAINCECWGLRNLIDGKSAYYSHDNGYTWLDFNTLSSGVSIDFTNISEGDTSTLNIPVISRNRYWKLAWLAEDHPYMNIREMMPLYEDEEIDCTFYHEKTLPLEDGPITDTAPHLRNNSVIGSYYKLGKETSIGFDFGSQKALDKLNWFHDSMSDYSNLYCGIDKYTKLNLTVKDFNIVDYSYDEREFTVNGSVFTDYGKWDIEYIEVPTVSGLYSSSDTTPTNGTLIDEPTFVDGDLWYTDSQITSKNNYMNTNRSYGIDFGSPKEIDKLEFYLSIPSSYGISGWYNYFAFYIYKSNDNINWELAYSYVMSPYLSIQETASHFFVELFFPKKHTARYFKLWCSGYTTVNVIGSSYTSLNCSEIKAYNSSETSYKTGIGFGGSLNDNISVPASSDLVFPTIETIFSLDFAFKFNSLPVASGMDYCNLAKNWIDDITTSKFSNVVYPPEERFSGALMETQANPAPYANYAILVRSVYDIARLSGSTYSSSGGSSISNAFDGEINTTIAVLNGNSNIWLEIDLPEDKKIIKYGIYSHSTTASRNLKDFTFQTYVTASGIWMDLHSVAGYVTSEYVIEYYTFSNPYPASKKYRLYVNSNNGYSSYTDVNELLLFDADENVIPYFYQLEVWVQSYVSYNGYYWIREKYNLIESESNNYMSLTRGSDHNLDVYINGIYHILFPTSPYQSMSSHSEDLIIGGGFDGVISDFRITKEIERTDYSSGNMHPNERFYTLSMYVSEDNIEYGKYCDIDLYKENSYSYYYSNNVFSSDYYSMLAIDLENRYDIDLIRSYGDSDRQIFSIYRENSYDVYYSNDEIDDVTQVSWSTRDDYENSVILFTTEAYGYSTYPTITVVTRSFSGKDCTGLTKENGIFILDIQCPYENYDPDLVRGGKIQISSSGGVTSETWEYILTNADIAILLDHQYHTFYLPLKDFDTVGSELDVSNINYIRMYLYPTAATYIYLYIYWKNGIIHWSLPEAIATSDDVRWLRFDLLSGDGEDRVIRKLGVYPDISTQLSPAGGHYNHEWDYLGKSVTAYESSTNLALGATVSGSSYFGVMNLNNITNGLISSGDDADIEEANASFYEAWGSEDEASPWVYVDLGAIYSVYRFKIYHGYDGVDTKYLITDYEVQTSKDNQTYTTHFTITDNTLFERTHDLSTPVQARYVKIAITGYNSQKILLRTDLVSNSVDFFEGAVMREIEVYEYYGYPVINSEEYPIVAINMFDQFYLSSHSVVGIDAEDNTTDWSNENYNFCYSDSVLNSPSKVDFREWNNPPGYDKWAVIKMDTATNYRNGPHYLKHVRITSLEDQNPCGYPWWWQTSVSTVSRDYNYSLASALSALKIEYPASTTIDDVYFIEGDHFGVDTLASWRDGLSFRFRIDDVENLDRSFGYFYLGGYDSSSGANPIIYKWYLSTLSGSLNTGWNNLYLRFKQADEIEYIFDARESQDLRIINTIDLGKLGMRYRGVGNEITMHFDGFRIERNRFYDYSGADVGFYMNNNDYITAPIGEYDMSRGTIEFWFRPDYNYNATDYYGEMKNRAIFNFNNNTNDVFGLMVAYTGFELYFGNTGETLNSFYLGNLGLNILDVLFHVGIVFSNDGTQIDSDGSTIRLYFNNKLMFKSTTTWEVSDNKHFTFIFGGKAPLNLKAGAYIETSSIDAVVSDLKIYNYCKKDFYNSIRNIEDKADKLIKPSNFIEISKNNLTYYKVGATSLPLAFPNVAQGVSIPIYVRVNTPDGLTGKESRTAGLLCYWDISV